MAYRLIPKRFKSAVVRATGQQVAVATALDELYGLGYGNCDVEDIQYEAVTLADVRCVAEKYFNKESCVVAVVRPAELTVEA